MLQVILICHLGADVECKNTNGKEFSTFRVANTDKWTDDAGQVHENTTWVDCILNGCPSVTKFLRKGQQVYVSGSMSLRVYSSAKDKCMKAGVTINVRQIELLGGRTDDVPSLLYREGDNMEVAVGKFYYAPSVQSNNPQAGDTILIDKNGGRYKADKDGWVVKEKTS